MVVDTTSFVDQSTMNTTVSKTMLEAINSSQAPHNSTDSTNNQSTLFDLNGTVSMKDE